MTEQLSKILLAIEAIVIVAPMTLLFSLVAVEMFVSPFQFERLWQLELLAAAIIVVSLVAGWSLMARFWRYGARSLESASWFLWGMSLTGAAATLISVACLATGAPLGWPRSAERSLWALAWGLPLLLPLGHLLAERHCRSTVNTS